MSGLIYIFCNKINGKKYIGQTSKKFNIRLMQHIKRSPHPIQSFHKAIKKYGIENFYIIKIQYPKEELNKMEMYFIKFFNSYKSGYNETIGGTSGNLGYKWNDMQLENHRYGLNNPNYGNKWTEKQKEKMRKMRIKNGPSWKGNKNPSKNKKILEKKSEQTRKNYILINKDKKEYYIKGIRKFCREFGIDHGSLYYILRGHSKSGTTKNGWSIKRL